MTGTPYLIDSNVLLRWVKPDDRDYPLVVSAIDATLQRGAVFCYTSQNVAEFWNTCTRPLDRNGYGLSPQEADRRARLFEDKLRLLPDSLLFTKNGATCVLRAMSPGFMCTMRDWWPQCEYTGSAGF